jgi:hypothetical protein
MAVMRAAVREAGVDVLATVALGCEDEGGNTVVIAAGRDLPDLAVRDEPIPVPPTAS